MHILRSSTRFLVGCKLKKPLLSVYKLGYESVCSFNLNEKPAKTSFGVVFDIDGVLLRGKTVIKSAKEALQSLVDTKQNKFNVPCVFLTNGFGLPEVKAKSLSKLLDINIHPKQMVMAQTPLETYQAFHDKWCLVSGPDHDGGAEQVARSLGFKKIITMDDLRHAYPYLDWVDRSRWPTHEMEDDVSFPAVEAVLLLGETTRWETNLQLITDVLLTNGRPNQAPNHDCPQLPVLAVNMDLQWMAKAANPRFGHGAFLVCLESLYKKLSGRDLVYSALIGKPSEMSYVYTQRLLQQLAAEMDLPDVAIVYIVGDNPLTDIYGANLFNRLMEKSKAEQQPTDCLQERYVSFLVCTGIYKPRSNSDENSLSSSYKDLWQKSDKVRNKPVLCPSFGEADHGHRDLPFDEELTRPDYVVDDVKDAIEIIFELENCRDVRL